MTIRKLTFEETPEALELAWNVFADTEAVYYSPEGIKTFYDSINNKEYAQTLDTYGAFINNNLVGMISTRDNGNHIALFFVSTKLQRNGIGKSLFDFMIRNSNSAELTVNSSRTALEVYKKFGFTGMDCEQIKNGIIYTPMKRMAC